jgi:hypothetical protein
MPSRCNVSEGKKKKTERKNNLEEVDSVEKLREPEVERKEER